MSFENPLDRIKKMNADNLADKEEENSLSLEKEKIDQEVVDHEYLSVTEDKDNFDVSIEKLRGAISKIEGSKEEIEEQIHLALEEASKDPETLKHVKDNYEEVFSGLISKKNKLEIEKQDSEDSHLVEEVLSRENDKKIDSLYSKTTGGKEEANEEKMGKVEILWKEVTQYTDGRDNEYFGKTFDEIQGKLSLDEIQELLESNKKLKDIESNSFIKNEKWELLSFNKWQGKNIETIMGTKELLKNKYTELVSEYKKEKSQLLTYKIPDFEDIIVERFAGDYCHINLSQGFDEINEVTNEFSIKESQLREKVQNIKNTFFKIGLKNAQNEFQKVETENKEFDENNSWNKLVNVEKGLSEELTSFYNKIALQGIPSYLNEIKNGNKISDFFQIMEEDKSFSQEEKDLIEEENILMEKIKEIKEKVEF
ncbi:MAG: hypothetical protein ACJAV6_000566 [Candidatus Paceibacteria bacterium]|jgi:hypothetical protein